MFHRLCTTSLGLTLVVLGATASESHAQLTPKCREALSTPKETVLALQMDYDAYDAVKGGPFRLPRDATSGRPKDTAAFYHLRGRSAADGLALAAKIREAATNWRHQARAACSVV